MQTQVARNWETWLRNSIGPASDTEQADAERTEKRIRKAIEADARLAGNVRIFVKGSYANNTNVRQDSDVDIAVEWKAWSYLSKSNSAADLDWPQLGVTLSTQGPEPAEYRRWVEEALFAAFGPDAVDNSGNKAITVTRGTTTLDADVVPCYRHERYDAPNRQPHVGIRLYPKTGRSIENWPDQNRKNGNVKNVDTGQRYKQIVRALKRLENDMLKRGVITKEVHGFFIESLLFNLPDSVFRSSALKQATLDVLARLWNEINDGNHKDWVEVNALKWLWRSGQTWTAAEASAFAHAAWNDIEGN
ncbi:MAG TPA: nucleotidyltransferase [Solirubrobacterales bacterium]|nr:nucleotidyltransferase [Solirubrobacterales bacterium]